MHISILRVRVKSVAVILQISLPYTCREYARLFLLTKGFIHLTKQASELTLYFLQRSEKYHSLTRCLNSAWVTKMCGIILQRKYLDIKCGLKLRHLLHKQLISKQSYLNQHVSIGQAFWTLRKSEIEYHSVMEHIWRLCPTYSITHLLVIPLASIHFLSLSTVKKKNGSGNLDPMHRVDNKIWWNLIMPLVHTEVFHHITHWRLIPVMLHTSTQWIQ